MCQKLNQISQHDSIKQEEINVVLLILNRTVLIPVSKARMHEENRHLTIMSHMLETYHAELYVQLCLTVCHKLSAIPESN